VKRVKSKLQSYSHQNFLRQFIDSDNLEGKSICDEFIHDSSQLDLCFSGRPIYDSRGTEVIPKVLHKGDVSDARIKDRITAGKPIDNRDSNTTCRNIDIVGDLKLLYDQVILLRFTYKISIS
jgi:hypothetical protein